jgi:hypothetical protein
MFLGADKTVSDEVEDLLFGVDLEVIEGRFVALLMVEAFREGGGPSDRR